MKNNNIFSQPGITTNTIDHFSEQQFREMIDSVRASIHPDTYACDGIFIKSFINDDMQVDFAIIANSFYMNVPESLTFRNYDYYTDISVRTMFTVDSFSLFTLSQILSMARSGNEYSRRMIKYLYKTYYKKEYKVLKKFSKISVPEILAVATDEAGVNVDSLARVLTICPFLGIELDSDCSILYVILERYNVDEDNSGNQNRSFDPQRLGEVSKEIRDIFEVSDKRDLELESKDFRKYDKFRKNVYKDMGFNPDFADIQNDHASVEYYYIRTLFILNRMYPGKSFSRDELQVYAAIYYDVFTTCKSMDDVDDYFKVMLGEIDDFTLEDSMFIPAEFEKAAGIRIKKGEDYQKDYYGDQVTELQMTGDNVPGNKAADIVGKTGTSGRSVNKEIDNKTGAGGVSADQTDHDSKALIEEIDALRKKLHKKDYDISHLSELYSEARSKLDAYEAEKEIYRTEHEELIALREHIYNLTEDDVAVQEEDREELIASVKDKKIVIVGGHTNWIQKMKDVFPNWTYINFKSVTTINDSVLNSCEYLFFFTDFIKHNVYYRFINLVRDKKIPFGYISNINIDKCVKQIAEEVNR